MRKRLICGDGIRKCFHYMFFSLISKDIPIPRKRGIVINDVNGTINGLRSGNYNGLRKHMDPNNCVGKPFKGQSICWNVEIEEKNISNY